MALNFNRYREQRKFMQIEAEKIILVLLSQQSYISFSKFSKRTNLELIFFIGVVGRKNCLAVVNIINSLFPSFVF